MFWYLRYTTDKIKFWLYSDQYAADASTLKFWAMDRSAHLYKCHKGINGNVAMLLQLITIGYRQFQRSHVLVFSRLVEWCYCVNSKLLLQ